MNRRPVIAMVSVLLAGATAKAGLMKVHYEKGKAWIKDVPALAWGKSGETTFCGALNAAAAGMGIESDYVRLMGDSALAMRLRWYRAERGVGWCPSSPVGEMGPWDQRAARSIGLKLEYKTELHDKADMSKYAQRVRASIDQGVPVLAYGTTLDVGVIYGYANEGQTVVLRDYFKGDAAFEMPLKETKGMLVFLSKDAPPASERDRAVEAMRAAVKDWRWKSEPFKQGRYLFGDAAYAEWIKNLDEQDLTPDQRKELFQPSWWTFCVLSDARRAAAGYLQRVAPLFEGDARASILKAADLYAQTAGVTGKVFGEKNAFLGPWSGRKIDDWTEEVRHREAELLSQARTLDNQAIAEIEKALSAIK